MKRMIFLAVVAALLLGCSTVASVASRAKAQVDWWNERGIGVVEVSEDYLLSDVPHTRIKTSSGTEFIFH